MAAAFHLVAGVLIVGALSLVPAWWSVGSIGLWLMTAGYGAFRWRQTSLVLGLSLGFLLIWMVVTLAVG